MRSIRRIAQTQPRRAASVWAVGVIAFVSCLVLSPMSASGAASHDVALMRAAIAHATAKRHVTVTTRSTYEGVGTTFVTESNPSSGIQRVTYVIGGVRHRATFILIHGVGYLRGDAVAIGQYLSISLDEAQHDADQWIEFTRHSPDYAFITGGVTIASLMSEVPLSGAIVTTAPSKVAGIRVTTLQGVAGAASYLPRIRERLSISRSSPSLPVRETADGQGIAQVMTFTRWGDATVVRAPKATLRWVSTPTSTTTTTTTTSTTTTTAPVTTTSTAIVTG